MFALYRFPPYPNPHPAPSSPVVFSISRARQGDRGEEEEGETCIKKNVIGEGEILQTEAMPFVF